MQLRECHRESCTVLDGNTGVSATTVPGGVVRFCSIETEPLAFLRTCQLQGVILHMETTLVNVSVQGQKGCAQIYFVDVGFADCVVVDL